MESEKCNSDELMKIIEAINPEVIFEEEPNDEKYLSCYSDPNSFKTLEIKTIIKYKQNHEIVNLPIDKPINEFASLFLQDRFNEMFKQNLDYMQLIKVHCFLRDKNGFSYLNSKQCSDLNENKILLEKQIIANSGPAKNDLNNLYNQFHQEIEARERKMIENIHNSTKSNKFNKAVFFLGYAHRESIRKQILEYGLFNSTRINWTFYLD
jgi:DNA-binding protein Fis